MTKSTKKKSTARKRTSIKDLPKSKQELTGKSMKKIKGGATLSMRKAGKDQQDY